jgi:chemotaxis signal transduction protein
VTLNPTRFVVVDADGRRAAIAVDAVLGVVELSLESASGLPPLLQDASSELVLKLSALDRELLYVLDTARIAPDALWTALVSRDLDGERGGESQH